MKTPFKTQHHLTALLWLSAILLLLPACKRGHNAGAITPESQGTHGIQWVRFEELMFGTPADQLQSTLLQQSETFAGTLLNVTPQDPNYMRQVIDMAQDATMREIFDTIERVFPSIDWLQKDFAEAIQRVQNEDNTIHYSKVITFASGLLDYSHRVAANDSTLLIALDQYVVPHFKKYGYFQLPSYLVALCEPQYILPDALAAIAREHIALAEQDDPMLLDYIIAEGKVLYFLERVLPQAHDTLLLRYTPTQLSWAKSNTDRVWAYWIQNQILFNREYNTIFNFIDDAPKTNAFGNDSAPRMTSYIGWQIVRQYMERSKSTLHQLFQNADAKEILKTSGWKPSRK